MTGGSKLPIPQGLKPALLLTLGGTAEAVPYPKQLIQNNLPKTICEIPSSYPRVRPYWQLTTSH